MVYVGICGERAHGATARPIAEDILDKQMVRRVLDSDALVLVADFNVMDVNVGSPDVNTVQTASCASVNDCIVHFSVRASVQREVERRSFIKPSAPLSQLWPRELTVNKSNVVHRKALDVKEAKYTRAVFVI